MPNNNKFSIKFIIVKPIPVRKTNQDKNFPYILLGIGNKIDKMQAKT